MGKVDRLSFNALRGYVLIFCVAIGYLFSVAILLLCANDFIYISIFLQDWDGRWNNFFILWWRVIISLILGYGVCAVAHYSYHIRGFRRVTLYVVGGFGWLPLFYCVIIGYPTWQLAVLFAGCFFLLIPVLAYSQKVSVFLWDVIGGVGLCFGVCGLLLWLYAWGIGFWGPEDNNVHDRFFVFLTSPYMVYVYAALVICGLLSNEIGIYLTLSKQKRRVFCQLVAVGFAIPIMTWLAGIVSGKIMSEKLKNTLAETQKYFDCQLNNTTWQEIYLGEVSIDIDFWNKWFIDNSYWDKKSALPKYPIYIHNGNMEEIILPHYRLLSDAAQIELENLKNSNDAESRIRSWKALKYINEYLKEEVTPWGQLIALWLLEKQLDVMKSINDLLELKLCQEMINDNLLSISDRRFRLEYGETLLIYQAAENDLFGTDAAIAEVRYVFPWLWWWLRRDEMALLQRWTAAEKPKQDDTLPTSALLRQKYWGLGTQKIENRFENYTKKAHDFLHNVSDPST